MSVVKIPETMLVYKALELNADGISLDALKERSGVSEEQLTNILKALAENGLVLYHDGRAYITKWWEFQRLEVMFQLPWIDENVFRQICDDLEDFAKAFHGENYYTLKPYSHETTLEIILSIASGVVLGEFFRAFFKEWGTKAAALLDKLFQRYGKHGIDQICINGTFHPKGQSDSIKFNFEVKASTKGEVLKGMEFIEKELMTAIESQKLSSDFIRESGDWKITVWRV